MYVLSWPPIELASAAGVICKQIKVWLVWIHQLICDMGYVFNWLYVYSPFNLLSLFQLVIITKNIMSTSILIDSIFVPPALAARLIIAD